MALNFSANQYESAYRSNKLQNWNLAKRYKERPSRVDGYTVFIANDRGHLFEGCQSELQRSPWGTFMGTWDMPLKIPPCKVSMTARSAKAANHLRNWVCSSNALICAANGLRPQINGKEVRPTCHRGSIQQGSGRSCRCSSQPPGQNRCSSGQQHAMEAKAIHGKSPEGLSCRQLSPECICVIPPGMESEFEKFSTPKSGHKAPEPHDPNDSCRSYLDKDPRSNAATQGSARSRRCASEPPDQNRHSADPEGGTCEVPQTPAAKKSPSPKIQQAECTLATQAVNDAANVPPSRTAKTKDVCT